MRRFPLDPFELGRGLRWSRCRPPSAPRWSICTRTPTLVSAGLQPSGHRLHRRFLARGDHPGSGQHVDVARPQRAGGVGFRLTVSRTLASSRVRQAPRYDSAPRPGPAGSASRNPSPLLHRKVARRDRGSRDLPSARSRHAYRGRVRRAVRRGQAELLGPPGRRQDRRAQAPAVTAAPASGWSWATRPGSPTPPICPRPGLLACGRGGRGGRPAVAAAVSEDGRPRPPDGTSSERDPDPARRRSQGHQGGAAQAGRRDGAGAGRRDPSGAASYGDSRRRILVANSDGLLSDDDQVRTHVRRRLRRRGDTGMQTGTGERRTHRRLRAVRPVRRRGAGPTAAAVPSPSCRPDRRQRSPCRL